jgi:hypothetical protein
MYPPLVAGRGLLGMTDQVAPPSAERKTLLFARKNPAYMMSELPGAQTPQTRNRRRST